jgi:hypothetical protein
VSGVGPPHNSGPLARIACTLFRIITKVDRSAMTVLLPLEE